MMKLLSREELEQGIRDVDSEAEGVLSVVVVSPENAAALLGEALAGDQDATRLMKAVGQICMQIDSAPKTKPLLCVSCPRPLRGSAFSFAFAMANQEEPNKAITMGICHRCATTPQEVMTRAAIHLRKIWPDLRSITHSAGGRA